MSSRTKAFDPDKRRAALRTIMVQHKLTVNGWTKLAGIAESTLRNFLNGDADSLSDRSYELLAKAKSLPVAVLRGESAASIVPLFGYAGAGAQVFPFDGNTDVADWLPAPPDLNAGAAVIVKGDSMLPRFADGDTLYFERAEVPLDRAIGRECVVQVKDGPVLVKRVERGARRGRYHLMSINPSVATLEDQAIDWAAEVAWVRRFRR